MSIIWAPYKNNRIPKSIIFFIFLQTTAKIPDLCRGPLHDRFSHAEAQILVLLGPQADASDPRHCLAFDHPFKALRDTRHERNIDHTISSPAIPREFDDIVHRLQRSIQAGHRHWTEQTLSTNGRASYQIVPREKVSITL